jgi:hypothetical protein
MGGRAERRLTPGRRAVVGALVALLVSFGTMPMAAADWTPPEDIASGGYNISAVDVHYDASGRAYAFFHRAVGASGNTLHLRERAPGTGTWGPLETIPASSPTPSGMVSAVNAAGDIVVGYTSGGRAEAIRRPAGGSWETPVSYSSPGTAGPFSGYAARVAIDIGDDGSAVLAWTPRNSCCGVVSRWRAMAAAYQPGIGWDAVPQLWNTSTSDVHMDPVVGVDDNGQAVVAWGGRQGVNLDLVYTADWAAGTWSAPVQRGPSSAGSNVELTADAAGSTIALVFSRSTTMSALVRTNGVWSPTYFLSGSQSGNPPSVDVGANDTVFAAWNNQSPSSMRVARRLPGQSFTQEEVVGPADGGRYPVVAANATNDLVLLWNEYVALDSAVYAYAATAPANGPFGPPTQLTTAPASAGNEPILSAAVDPWGRALVAAAPIPVGSGYGTTVITSVETGVGAAVDLLTEAVIQPGAAESGDVLTCTNTAFLGTPPFTYSYEWKRDGVPISGADQATFTVRPLDVASGLTCVVTATNEAGSASVESAELIVDYTAPSNLVPPSLSGVAEAGEIVDCDEGTWAGEPDPDITFEWLVNGVATGETSSSFEVTVNEAGSTLACLVTATNDGGVDQLATAAVNVPSVSPPLNVTPPRVNGASRPSLGTPLTCATGSWTGEPAPQLFFDWLRDGQLIPGAYDSEYVVTSDDAATTLSCQVSGENIAGDQTVASSNTRVIDPLPVNTVLPRVLKAPGPIWGVGATARCAKGTWSYGLTYAYQWFRDGATIDGASDEMFLITSADMLTELSCTVTATGRMGTTQATSLPKIVPGAPTNTVAPKVAGIRRPGRTLTCQRGTWLDASSYAYSWQRDGTPLASVTNKYVVAVGDIGATITCGVTATNGGGSTTAYSPGVVISP